MHFAPAGGGGEAAVRADISFGCVVPAGGSGRPLMTDVDSERLPPAGGETTVLAIAVALFVGDDSLL